MENLTAYLASPLGPLRLTSDGISLTGLWMEGDQVTNTGPTPTAPPLAEAISQLEEYFEGRRTHFDLPLAPQGTAFQHTVWEALLGIPYGDTISYGELAARVGQPRAARAVGMANGRNPISIIIPCHRVIGASGKLTGYGGGLPRKEALLAFEEAVLRQGPHTFAPRAWENLPLFRA